MFPYIVWAPPFDRRSGGCKTLHALAYEIQKRNTYVYMNTDVQHPPWKVAPLTNDPAIERISKSGAIAVYPEIIFGNPFNCKTVVRWVLNRPGKIGGPTEYPPEDLIYPFSKAYGMFGLPDERQLFLPTIELDIYYDRKLPRSGICFYVGKGSRTKRIPETAGAKEITRGWPQEQNQLAELFCRSELFITYDVVTSLYDNARLCGCPVVIVPDGYFKKDEINLETGWLGCGWGIEETDKAKSTMNSEAMRNIYVEKYQQFQDSLTRFIEYTQKIATERNV